MVFLQGLENIWVVSFVKEYQFQRDFYYNVACKVMGVAVTIGLAAWLRSYWALVYGQATTAILRVALSYAVVPAASRFDLSRWREIWSFSQWSLVKGVALYAVNQADRLILGRLLGAEMVGAYAVAKQIAQIPMQEISMPVNRTLSPGFASLQDDPPRLTRALLKSTGRGSRRHVPCLRRSCGDGTAYRPSRPGTGVGERRADPSVPGAERNACLSSWRALECPYRNRTLPASAIFMWVRAILFLGPAIPATMWYGAEGAAATFLASEVVSFGLLLIIFQRALPEVTLARFLSALVRPTLSVAVMTVCVTAISATGIEAPIPRLAAEVVVGVVSYGAVLFFMWVVMGKPDGWSAFS